jgi:transposase-like protein
MQGVEFRPTEEQRRLVRAFAGFGVPQEDIARHIGIEPKTLRRHFREELGRSRPRSPS